MLAASLLPELTLDRAGREMAALLRARSHYTQMVRELSAAGELGTAVEDALESQVDGMHARLYELYWMVAELKATDVEGLHTKVIALSEQVSGDGNDLITVLTLSIVETVEALRGTEARP